MHYEYRTAAVVNSDSSMPVTVGAVVEGHTNWEEGAEINLANLERQNIHV
jgi:hypothetical protein